MKKDELGKIKAAAEKCKKCKLCEGRSRLVPGDGSSEARIMLIGEAPGKNEDLQGRPFVGSAGKILADLLASIDLQREDVYITNVVKCRPPMNRDPLPEEISCCAEYLEQEVDIIRPELIVLLGRHAMEHFLPGLKISVDHGNPKRRGGQVYFPVYHPAAAIYQRSLMETVQKDFQKIPKILKTIKKEKDQP